MGEKRKVLIHYHIFKNAGTSIDHMLKQSLGERWVEWDTPHANGKISPAELEAFILDHPDVVAVSSHQAVPPLPDRHLQVFPIVLLRHPLDRAYSAYLFEWGKQKNAAEPVGRFEDYIAEKFSQPRRNAIEDFQTLHLANRGYENRSPSKELDDEELLRNAKSLVRSLPFFGIVEEYDASLAAMRNTYGADFPELSFDVYRDNVLQDADQSLYQKVRRQRESTDRDAFNELVLRNQMDLRLYEYAAACFSLLAERAA